MMPPKRTLVIVALIVLSTAVDGVRAGEVQLVRDGVAEGTIVIDNYPTPSARLAAKELQYHIEAITGAVLPIVNFGDVIEGTRILVGESAATRELGFRGKDFESQEYLIRAEAGTIILMGHDWFDTPTNRLEIGLGIQHSLSDSRKTIEYNAAVGRRGALTDDLELPGLMDDQGTCYATYDFLERFCGVRWYGPSALSVVLPSRKTLAVPEIEIRRRPSLLHRYAPGGNWPILAAQWGRHDGSQKALFLRRIRYGGERWGCNHSFSSYRDRFLVKNPERPELFERSRPDFFAVGWENEGFWRQLCMTNPDVIAQVVQDARDYFDGKDLRGRQYAIGDYFSVVPEDSDHWCKCERCQAILERGKSRDIKHTFGTGAASDYVFGFVNAVAKEVKKTHPDKLIATLAYHCYSYPPTFALESNVAVAPCVQTCYAYCPGVFKSDAQFYADWIAENQRSGRKLHVWNYFHHPMERALIDGFNCFPCFMPDVISHWVKRYADDGVRGFYLCGAPQQLDYYLYMQLAFNAELDDGALIDEFFTNYFGAAGPPMQAFYGRISEINRIEKALGTTEKASWEKLGTAERMEELGALMEQAVSAASTEEEKLRVESWKKGIWNYMVEGRRAYAKAQRAKDKKDHEIQIYGTGLDDDHGLLPDKAVDPHWRLVESQDDTWKGPQTVVVAADAEPIPPWPERQRDAKSKWIAPHAGAVVAAGDYDYEQTFALTDGMDLDTASLFGRLMSDDHVKRFELNGVQIKKSGNCVHWTEFVITDHFVVGENRLRICTTNAGKSPNPHGVRIEVSGYVDARR